MVTWTTFPDFKLLTQLEKETPTYMRPNRTPSAVIAEALIPPEECDVIVKRLMKFEGQKHEECGAITRECGHVPELDSVRDFTFKFNALFWQYVLDPEPMSWMQTYFEGGSYQLHMDGSPAQTRKLTAVLLLTDPAKYDGGILEVNYHPAKCQIPKTQGTVVIFQPWILHEVYPVTFGLRQSVNMSFWGPNFI